MIDFVIRLASDERSLLIVVAAVVCWLITREKPSVHAAGGLLVFLLAFSLFVMWKYAPSYTPVDMPPLEAMTADQLREYIAERNKALNVLWRQMEMYVVGVHLTAVLYLVWVWALHIWPSHKADIMALVVVSALLGEELYSVATGNGWCRFVLETPGEWLLDHLMAEGWTPGSCSVHWGEVSDWWPIALGVAFLALASWYYTRAKKGMT